jgi:cobalt/nickel transport system permease protein
VLFVGIFNPFFDRNVLFDIGIPVTGGMVSMLTLMLKGFYCVLSAYVLIATTSIEEICYALRRLHVPKVLVMVILLIYRYFGLMGNEADRIATAYSLRAPGQKGINYKAWGTLVGQWLLRSMDKAEMVYESMLLRGFTGDFRIRKKSVKKSDVIYPIICIAVIIILRHIAL